VPSAQPSRLTRQVSAATHDRPLIAILVGRRAPVGLLRQSSASLTGSMSG
jgi:hypothetical protein